MASCDGCPDYIKAAVAKPVSDALAQVRAVKFVVNGFNASVRQFTDEVIASVTSGISVLVGELPNAPALAPGDIIGLLTCPITPIALALDPAVLANLDPARVVELVKQSMSDYITELVKWWEDSLVALATWPSVKVFKQFFDDLRRVQLDTTLLVKATATSAAVRALCIGFYETGPFEEFDEEMADFSVVGLIPSTVSSTVVDALVQLQAGELKIQAWRVFVAS